MSEQFDPRRPYDVPVYREGQFEIERGVNPADLAAARQLESELLMRNRILIAEGESARLQENMVRNLEAIKGLQEGILGVINERVTRSSAQELEAQSRLRVETEKRLDAEHEVDRVIQERGSRITDQLRSMNELRSSGMNVRIGQARETLSERQIQQLFTTPTEELGALDQARREAVRQRMIDREMASGALATARQESGVGETIRNLIAQGRSGRGLAAGELIGSLRGVSLGPIGLAFAAAAALPQIMNTVERTWNNTVGLPLNQIQQSRRLGMITGGGFREGFGMRRDAFLQGFNPFDLVSRQMALEIQQGLASQGFRGDLREALGDTVIGAVNDLGIEHATAIELVTTAYRRNGMALEEIKDQLSGMDDLAQSIGRSVDETTQTWTRLNELFTTLGAGRRAGTLAEGVMRTLITPGSSVTEPMITGLLQDETIMGMAGAAAGILPDYLLLPENQERFPAALQTAVNRLLTQTPGRTMEEKAAMLRRLPAFASWGVPEILDLARASSGQEGFDVQSRFGQASRFFTSAMARQRREMGDFIMQGTGPIPVVIRAEDREVEGEDLARIHRNTLAQLRGVLEPEELKEFQRNIGNRKFDVQAFIRRASKPNEQVGDTLNIGGIKIELSGQGRQFFRLRGRENDAVNRGLAPPWSQYMPGEQRAARSNPGG